MPPKRLIVEFWNDVEKELQGQTRGGGRPAIQNPKAAINDFKLFIKEHGITEMIYHRDPKFIADTIAGKRKFPAPPKGAAARRVGNSTAANGKQPAKEGRNVSGAPKSKGAAARSAKKKTATGRTKKRVPPPNRRLAS